MRTSIALTQEPDGQTFRVARFAGTSELRIGAMVPAETIHKWATDQRYSHVSFSVIGMTPQGETNDQPDLLEAAPRRNGKVTVKV
ncbi:MAG: hypothetical protein KGJ13_08885 [Patescibacteria group bacterium]|nr:hypothetical protein [Patescibacteria group bacterium]